MNPKDLTRTGGEPGLCRERIGCTFVAKCAAGPHPPLGARAHVQRISGKPHGFDANHLTTTAAHCAKSAAARMGQRSSTVHPCAAWSCPETGSAMALGRRSKGMNAGSSDRGCSGAMDCCDSTGRWQPVRACSLSQRCSTLAFMPWLLANAAIEFPGCWQIATSSALKAGGYAGRCISRCLSLRAWCERWITCTRYCETGRVKSR